MAKSIRSKVKKRLRTVKRGVVKREQADPSTKLGAGVQKVKEKLAEAASGYIAPGKRLRSAFRYDDDDAEIAQHNWRQGPDYRSGKIGGDAGYALVGARRPKKGNRGGDAPSSIVQMPAADVEQGEGMEGTEPPPPDATVSRLHTGTEQLLPFRASRKLKRKLKNKSGIDNNVFRWT
uniref:Uncharacterized protein n=1 Tax=Coccolithus braarudii TaxID=221442 RepID=A0A7S0Q6D2_9EUKA|mmetsp:Transcript_40086/g.85602  ORF Transcript_40086/g.85602 Transcript_40086/m.85602 type:complete len:177 (+) Transcript_40086:134-664(+)|eukprot:CAMPEP_0183352956 /NCGR_PEP_ID=MMETSP0164_2-20130417/31770_1 /TAXON_ID=221442 /ORGANISM="Coccolithus pelagicus ssp braarudi, Strain PLY182g" /LENGTH=176 /DNA_ID=CAMNT_0025525533 /DNA_START=111 /DNA_END=641 /DNA_ORIENTATION=-